MNEPDVREPQELDPFAYFPGAASKIRPFGGPGESPEPGYGFHTHYVRCAPGHCVFCVEMDGLTASNGLLYLQVHMLSTATGAHAKLATIERIEITELMRRGGRASIRFESLKGMIYALFGRVPETTDATATAIRIQLDRPGQEADEYPPDLTPTTLGQGAARPADQLTSLDPPRFANPVSQICTAAQIDEPAFARWCAVLGSSPLASVALWETCFIPQVLESYGLLGRNAQGLGLGEADGLVAAILARRGCEILLGQHATDMPSDAWEAERWQDLLQSTDIPADARARIRIMPAFLPAPQPELGQFDFLWSRTLAGEFGSVQAAHDMIVESIARLRPGGIAIHMLRLRADDAPDAAPEAPTALLRAETQRMALDIMSRGHVVAQLKFGGGRGLVDQEIAEGTTGFGLLIRRG